MNETKKRTGRPPQDTIKQPRIDVLVNHDLRHRIRVAAAARDMRLGEWAKAAFEEKLARDAARGGRND